MELTQDNFVVVTRGTGRYYVSEQRAKNLIDLINDINAPKMVELDGAFIAISDIAGIASAHQIEMMDRQRRGDWRCKFGNWHAKTEQCKCNWGKQPKSTEFKEPEMTPEQRERAELITQLREKGYIGSKMLKFKGKSNSELRTLLERS